MVVHVAIYFSGVRFPVKNFFFPSLLTCAEFETFSSFSSLTSLTNFSHSLFFRDYGNIWLVFSLFYPFHL